MSYHRYSIISHPVRLHWAGWETDTYKLGQYGWNISANEQPENRCFSLALNHPKMNLYAMSDYINMEYFDFHNRMSRIKNLNVPMMHFGREIRFQVVSTPISITDFKPIDPQPRALNYEIHDLSDFNIFKKVNPNTQEILLEKASLSEIMKAALSKQAPKQAEIRQKMLNNQKLKELRQDSEEVAQLRLVA